MEPDPGSRIGKKRFICFAIAHLHNASPFLVNVFIYDFGCVTVKVLIPSFTTEHVLHAGPTREHNCLPSPPDLSISQKRLMTHLYGLCHKILSVPLLHSASNKNHFISLSFIPIPKRIIYKILSLSGAHSNFQSHLHTNFCLLSPFIFPKIIYYSLKLPTFPHLLLPYEAKYLAPFDYKGHPFSCDLLL